MTLSPTAGIVSLGAYTPRRIFTNDEWSQYVDTSDEWIRSRTGIERRRIAADDETTATLALEAARDAIQRAGLTATDIDEIVVATDTQEIIFPDTACFVQHGLGTAAADGEDTLWIHVPLGAALVGLLAHVSHVARRVGGPA